MEKIASNPVTSVAVMVFSAPILGHFAARPLGTPVFGGRELNGINLVYSGLQKGPAERGHVEKRQKSSKSVKKLFDTFRQFSRRAKNVKNRQKVSKSFSTLFDNFRAGQKFFRPLLQSAD